MKLEKQVVENAAKFSNFSQWVKMEYWKKLSEGYRVPEIYLDDILLIAWSYFADSRKAQLIERNNMDESTNPETPVTEPETPIEE